MAKKITVGEPASLLEGMRKANSLKARLEREALRQIALIHRYKLAVETLERQIISGPSSSA